jgi:predicted nucleotidyltransferase
MAKNKLSNLHFMNSSIDIENKLRNIKSVLVDEFQVSRIGYFGSHASGKQTDNSDLDLLVEFSKPIGWKFFTLEKFLEQTLGLPIDLVTENALKERIKESILNQVIYI